MLLGFEAWNVGTKFIAHTRCFVSIIYLTIVKVNCCCPSPRLFFFKKQIVLGIIFYDPLERLFVTFLLFLFHSFRHVLPHRGALFPMVQVLLAVKFKCHALVRFLWYFIPSNNFKSHFLSGVQQGSIHGESKQSQSRKAIIRMLGKKMPRKQSEFTTFPVKGIFCTIKSFMLLAFWCEQH